MARPKNMEELRDQLGEAFEQLKADPRREGQVKELANVAGKMISTAKAQLAYSLMRGEEPEIAFFGKTTGRPLSSQARRMIE